MSPIKAFLVLGAVVAATIGVIIATRSNPAPPAEPPTSTTVPTETEAIKIFNDLHELWRRSYIERDETLIRSFAAPDSPTLRDAEEIRSLRSHDVLDKSRFNRQSIIVVSRTRNELRIREIVRVTPRFVSAESGEDVTLGDTEEQTVLWTLRRYDNDWLLFDSLIEKAETVA